MIVSAFITARGAPPPLARAAALEDSLSSRGPQAPVSVPTSDFDQFGSRIPDRGPRIPDHGFWLRGSESPRGQLPQRLAHHPRVVSLDIVTIQLRVRVVLVGPIRIFRH